MWQSITFTIIQTSSDDDDCCLLSNRWDAETDGAGPRYDVMDGKIYHKIDRGES